MLELKHDADGQSILHNSMIVYGCGNTDGDRHLHSNLPVFLAGNGGGALNAGRNVRQNDAPICNLHLNMLDTMGVPALERYRSGTAGGEPDWLAGRRLFGRAINRSR